MMFLYSRQAIVFLFSMHTNVMPVARDLCTLSRWQRGISFLETDSSINVFWNIYGNIMIFIGRANGFLLRNIFYGDPAEAIDIKADTYCNTPCEKGTQGCLKYDRARPGDAWMLLHVYPSLCGMGAAMIVCGLLLPQLFYVYFGCIKRNT